MDTINKMSKYFIKSLVENNKEFLKSVNITDNHQHFFLSADKNLLNKNGFELKSSNIKSITEMMDYAQLTLKKHYSNPEKLHIIMKCVYETARNNHVKKVITSINFENLKYFENNVDLFKKTTKKLEKEFGVKFMFDLGIVKNTFNQEKERQVLSLLKTNFFKGLDLYGEETKLDCERFKNIFAFAKKLNLNRKVHVGEFSSAKEIERIILFLEPNHIQHGIKIVEDSRVMTLAKQRKIVFNICPTSNVFLGIVPSYKNHPIKTMFEFGLKITIGTDDITIFDNNIFIEYYKLYKSKCLTLKQLNQIRKNGIKYF